MQQQATVDRIVPLLRVHADRVHDAVRRAGCSPAAAVEVVETSALDLVADLAAGAVEDPLGDWFARADALAAQVQTDAAVPRGEGLLAADDDQALLGRALEALPDRQRLALLLRDSYDLPAASVGTALATTPDGAMDAVARARLAFLPGIDGQPAPVLGGHAADLAALARIGEGGPVAARDATTRRHAQACGVCRQVVEAQDYAHRLLSGLVVVALPDAEREPLLARVEEAARTRLPTAASLETSDVDLEEEDLPPRVLTPLAALLGLVLAAGLGLGLGLLTVRSPGGIDPALAAGALARPVTAAPVPFVTPPSAEQVQRAQDPPKAETRVETLPLRTLPPPPPPPEPEPVPTTQAPVAQTAIALTPDTGPNNVEITVSGTGWQPGTPVLVEYLDTAGEPTGSARAEPAEDGTFQVTLATVDPANEPGEHTVRASNGVQPEATATYVSTG